MTSASSNLPNIVALSPKDWADYELIDSGDGTKLERFGQYTLVRPEKRALWKRTLSDDRWLDVDAIFQQTGGKGAWVRKRPIPNQWLMQYKSTIFLAKLTHFRHTGVFPEQAPLWDWMEEQIRLSSEPTKILNLFAYTGIASLVAASAGASVTHVDASKPSLDWARENATAAGLTDRQIRWILDDALKFLKREYKRGQKYDGIVLNPPSFGRGPKGEIWRLEESLSKLLEASRDILHDRAVFMLISINDISDSSLALFNLLTDLLGSREGKINVGELVLRDRAKDKPMSLGIFGSWSNRDTV